MGQEKESIDHSHEALLAATVSPQSRNIATLPMWLTEVACCLGPRKSKETTRGAFGWGSFEYVHSFGCHFGCHVCSFGHIYNHIYIYHCTTNHCNLLHILVTPQEKVLYLDMFCLLVCRVLLCLSLSWCVGGEPHRPHPLDEHVFHRFFPCLMARCSEPVTPLGACAIGPLNPSNIHILLFLVG